MFKDLDRPLLLALISILGIGVTQVYSSSFIFATEIYGNGLHFVFRQCLAIVIGFIAFFVGRSISWTKWERAFPFLWTMTFVGLVLTFVPGLGIKIGGARRWINLGFIHFEPSEFFKVLIPWLFGYLHYNWNTENHWSRKPFAIFFWISPLFLLLKQPDFGTVVLVSSVTILLLFTNGIHWKFFAWLGAILVPIFILLVVLVPYRRLRVTAFLNPWADPSNSGFQLIQSLLSVRKGGFWGQGIGAGQGKLFFLPEAHTDFTLAVFAEENGFFGVAILFLLYAFIFLRSYQLGLRVYDVSTRLVVLGLTYLFGLHSLFNMAVVLGLLPTKGLTLPFLSYGGSSLICYCLAFGWILNSNRERLNS